MEVPHKINNVNQGLKIKIDNQECIKPIGIVFYPKNYT